MNEVKRREKREGNEDINPGSEETKTKKVKGKCMY
jgi:hypothetical protein